MVDFSIASVFLQEDMIHSQRFRAREEEYALPGHTVSL